MTEPLWTTSPPLLPTYLGAVFVPDGGPDTVIEGGTVSLCVPTEKSLHCWGRVRVRTTTSPYTLSQALITHREQATEQG